MCEAAVCAFEGSENSRDALPRFWPATPSLNEHVCFECCRILTFGVQWDVHLRDFSVVSEDSSEVYFRDIARQVGNDHNPRVRGILGRVHVDVIILFWPGRARRRRTAANRHGKPGRSDGTRCDAYNERLFLTTVTVSSTFIASLLCIANKLQRSKSETYSWASLYTLDRRPMADKSTDVVDAISE
jgi:hypothetical protein